MHQETPGLLPFLRGGAPRLGLFLPALLPPPAGRLGSGSSGSALSAPSVPETPASEPRLLPGARVTAAKEAGMCVVGSTHRAGGLIGCLGEDLETQVHPARLTSLKSFP